MGEAGNSRSTAPRLRNRPGLHARPWQANFRRQRGRILIQPARYAPAHARPARGDGVLLFHRNAARRICHRSETPAGFFRSKCNPVPAGSPSAGASAAVRCIPIAQVFGAMSSTHRRQPNGAAMTSNKHKRGPYSFLPLNTAAHLAHGDMRVRRICVMKEIINSLIIRAAVHLPGESHAFKQ